LTIARMFIYQGRSSLSLCWTYGKATCVGHYEWKVGR